MTFVPALIEPAPAAPAQPRPKRSRPRGRRPGDGGIELEIDGVVVRVARGADAKTVAAVIRALKAEP
jgi:transposase